MRFPGFEGEWESKKLGELTKLITKGTTPKKFSNQGIRYIKIECFEEDYINTNKCLFIDKFIHEKELKRSVLESNDILFAIAGATVGKVNIVTESILPANTNQALAIIRLKEFENPFFIYQILKSDIMKRYIKDTISVGAQPNLNLEQMNNFKFFCPNFLEQEKLAVFLSLIDKRIDTQSKIIEELELLKDITIAKIFTQQFKFKSDENFEDWENVTLGEVTTLVNTRNKDNRKLPIYSINNKVGFVPQGEQFDGVDSNARGYDIKIYKLIGTATFAYNPARINVGSLGYSGELNDIIISSLYVCFKANERVHDEFLLQYVKTDFFNKQVLENMEGGVRSYLFYENFSRIKLNLPCLEEQRKIASLLGSIDSKIDLENTILKKLKEQKQYLLSNIFI